MMKLVLADDHQVFAEGLGMVLDAEDDIEVLGVAPDGEEALRLLARHLPDVLLLDAHMPRTDLCKVVGTAKASAPGTRVVVLSADTRRQLVDAAIQAGADGFLAKDLMGWQVASALRRLLDGQVAPVTPALPARPPSDPSVELRVRTLSGRGSASCRSTRSAPTCRTSWSSSGSTPSWRRSPSPSSTRWSRAVPAGQPPGTTATKPSSRQPRTRPANLSPGR